MKRTEAYRIAVMASGAGSTFTALVDAERAGRLGASVGLLIVSRAEAEVVAVGGTFDITTEIVDEKLIGPEVAASTPVPVLPGDDVAALQARVQIAERELLIAAINQLATRG